MLYRGVMEMSLPRGWEKSLTCTCRRRREWFNMTSQQVQMPFAQISKDSLRLDLGSIMMIPPAGPECIFARSLNCLTNGGHLIYGRNRKGDQMKKTVALITLSFLILANRPVAAQEGAAPPLTHLARVAKQRKTSRIIWGVVETLIGGGMALGVSGSSVVELRLIGGGLTALGLKNLIFKSAAENAMAKALTIADDQGRDKAEGEALKSLVPLALLGRIVTGGFFLIWAAAIWSLPQPTAFLPGWSSYNKNMKLIVISGCTAKAADAFFNPSLVEKEYAKYKAERQTPRDENRGWNIGVGLVRKGFALTVVYTF